MTSTSLVASSSETGEPVGVFPEQAPSLSSDFGGTQQHVLDVQKVRQSRGWGDIKESLSKDTEQPSTTPPVKRLAKCLSPHDNTPEHEHTKQIKQHQRMSLWQDEIYQMRQTTYYVLDEIKRLGDQLLASEAEAKIWQARYMEAQHKLDIVTPRFRHISRQLDEMQQMRLQAEQRNSRNCLKPSLVMAKTILQRSYKYIKGFARRT